MNLPLLFDMNFDEHIDRLVDVALDIKAGKITILTGKNGSGKSFIRKVVSQSIEEQLKLDSSSRIVVSTSQELRTGSNPEMGALSGWMRDDGWNPTSVETMKHVRSIIKSEGKYIVIDEPEIGMGEETVMALVKFLNDNMRKVKHKGILIITHNRYVVENLDADEFFNIECMSKEEWLNRELIPTDLDELNDNSNKLFRAIQDRTTSAKKELKK